MKYRNKIISLSIIFLISIMFLGRLSFDEPEIIHTSEIVHGNFIFVGYNVEIVRPIIDDYIDYFNATIIDTLPKVEVDLLIIFAHGSNNGSGIFLTYNETHAIYTSDLLARQVIYTSCSIGIIRSIDLNTEHYAYSKTDELDVGYYNSSGTYTWSSFFLDYIKNDVSWADAEILARADIDNMDIDYR